MCVKSFLRGSLQLMSSLTLSVPEKVKSTIFEIPIAPQTLNINNKKTACAKSIKLHIVRKLPKYSLKNVL